MENKEKLKIVFDFIAEYLSDENSKTNTETEPLEKQIILEEEKTSNNPVYNKLKIDSGHITSLINKIDDLDKERALINRVITKPDTYKTSETKRQINEIVLKVNILKDMLNQLKKMKVT